MTDSDMIEGKGIEFTNSEGEECQVAMYHCDSRYLVSFTRSGKVTRITLTAEAAAALMHLLVAADLDPVTVI